MKLFALAAFLLMAVIPAQALEVQGLVTADCKDHVGIIIHVDDNWVEMIDLGGRFQRVRQSAVNNVFIFNVIDNPIEKIEVGPEAQARLKALYVENSKDPRALAFPVRFLEDLVIFYSLEGQSHVHTLADIYKLRPAGNETSGTHATANYKKTSFDLSGPFSHCRSESAAGAVKPTRMLGDKISIADFFRGFQDGYETLESFQERTYLYARPLLFEQRTRLGLVFMDKREETGIKVFPFYFQWSTGEAYRFQSLTVVGNKSHEWLPNAEPVVSLRSDVKSHVFHAVFIGNVLGVSAGSSTILKRDGIATLNGPITVQPSFNYLAMMGGDFGPWSASLGFYYPTFGIRVGDEYREVLGTSPSYAFRGMFTGDNFRVRGILSRSDYSSGSATKEDVLARTSPATDLDSPQSYSFDATFLRGGIDYEFSKRLQFSLDGIVLSGSYKETRNAGANDIKFNRFTIQPSVTQSFGNYVSLTGYVNFIQHTYESNFLNSDRDREQRETRYFGTFEFLF